MNRNFIVAVGLILVVLLPIISWADCSDQRTGGWDGKSIIVGVYTKERKGSQAGGSKIPLLLGQYMIGKEGDLINVTGYTFRQIFKAGLESYDIKDGSLQNVMRCVSPDSSKVLYVFDYD